MKDRLRFAASLALLLALAAPVVAEEELANLVPARTLAYLELHDPPRLSRELHALIHGSYLQTPAAFLARHTTGQRKPTNGEAFLLAWLASPEFIDELGDWQGGCLALTGVFRDEAPVVAGVLKTGKSRMTPLALRMILLDSGEVHCIGKVEGVPMFQIGDAEKRKPPEVARRWRESAAPLAQLVRGPRPHRTYAIALLEDIPVEEPEEKPEYGCFLSLMPGAIAFGSTPDSLADTIRRLKGKSAEPSLAAQPAFRAAAALRDRPGLFAWSDPPRLTRLINDMLRRDLIRRQDEVRNRPLKKGEKRDPAKIRAALRQIEEQQRRETQEWTIFQKLANPSGMHYAAAGWSLREGELSCGFEVRMKEKQTSPLLALLPHQKIGADLLRAVPGDAFALFALPLPDGAARLAHLLKLADTLQAGEEGATPPSRLLRELEKQWKVNLGRDVLARIQSAAVAVRLVGQPEKEAGVYPLLLLEAVSEEAAAKLEALVPRLYAAGDTPAEPRRHVLEGQVVHSLAEEAADSSLTGPPAHYGRRGRLLVLGWHRGGVAAALRDSARPKDLLNLPRGLATVNAEGAVSALGLFSCRQLLAQLTRHGSDAENQGPADLRALRYLREMSAPMATMPPTLFVVKRLPDGLRVEFRQSELPIASRTVIDIALTWMLDDDAAEAIFRKMGGGAPVAPPPAALIAQPAPAVMPAPPPPPIIVPPPAIKP